MVASIKITFSPKTRKLRKNFLADDALSYGRFLEGGRNISVLNQFWALLNGFIMISARQNVNETRNDLKLLHHYHIKKIMSA